ncbi:helix-turn-helix domain-containing protein [Paenibacillus sp. LMG 31456]|uniref:Helix-turn-helix domain-containing protein n=1 Tax=Paenibacillus foliorum TaxID=2654974 RepID=A0A972GKF8_9BACL|nr:AraC family transcriptional regulator [Paenibacillus foliorum]NOU91655.1 helix-turn-helix domain-containing protein [Paenibacillus foliorum]
MRLQHSKKAQTLIVMLLLTSLCITAMGYAVYRIATDTLAQEVQSAYHVSLQRTQDRVQNYFKQIDQSVLQFEKLPALESLIMPGAEENNLEILTLLETMLRMQTSIDDVDNIALYRISNKRLYSTNHQVTAFQEDYGAAIAKFEQTDKNYSFFNLTVKQAPTTVYIRKLPIFQGSKALYIIIHLNQQFFDHILGSSNEAKGNYFILDEDHQLLQNRGIMDTSRLMADVVPEILQERPASDKLFTAYLPPSYNGWIFGFAIPSEELFTKINGIRNVTFILAAILLALAVLVTILSTNRLWRGWKDIVSLLDEPAADTGTIHSAKKAAHRDNEFHHIYDKMQRIKETRDELKEQVKELTPEIREAFIRNMLQKGLRSQEDLDKCERYQIELLSGGYSCYCVEIDQYKSMSGIYSEIDLYYFRYGLSLVIQEVMDGKGKGVITRHGEGRFLALISLEDTAGSLDASKAAIHEAATTIRDFIEQYFPFTVSIGISLMRKDYAYISLSSQEAEDALKHKLVTGTNEIIPIEEFRRESDGAASALPISFRELENDVIYAIRSLDPELAYRYIDRLGELQGLRTISYQWLQSQLTEMVFSIYRTVGSTLRKPSAEPLMSDLMQLATLEEWIAWLKSQVVDLLSSELQQEHRKHMLKVSQQLTAYIHEHNEEDLRLEVCCKSLNVPTSIGKQALKEVQDTTFSDFLLQSRIEKAQSWLIHSEMSIEEMSSRLQYSNAQNFSRTFKKVIGLPPGQYRKDAREQLRT